MKLLAVLITLLSLAAPAWAVLPSSCSREALPMECCEQGISDCDAADLQANCCLLGSSNPQSTPQSVSDRSADARPTPPLAASTIPYLEPAPRILESRNWNRELASRLDPPLTRSSILRI